MFGVQAIDLRTYVIAGHYDAPMCLSPATVELYTAVRKVVARPSTSTRPYIWNDHEQSFDEHIARISSDIAAGGLIVQAIEEVISQRSLRDE